MKPKRRSDNDRNTKTATLTTTMSATLQMPADLVDYDEESASEEASVNSVEGEGVVVVALALLLHSALPLSPHPRLEASWIRQAPNDAEIWVTDFRLVRLSLSAQSIDTKQFIRFHLYVLCCFSVITGDSLKRT